MPKPDIAAYLNTGVLEVVLYYGNFPPSLVKEALASWLKEVKRTQNFVGRCDQLSVVARSEKGDHEYEQSRQRKYMKTLHQAQLHGCVACAVALIGP